MKWGLNVRSNLCSISRRRFKCVDAAAKPRRRGTGRRNCAGDVIAQRITSGIYFYQPAVSLATRLGAGA